MPTPETFLRTHAALTLLGSALLTLAAGCEQRAPEAQAAIDATSVPAKTEVSVEPRVATLLPFAADQLLELGVAPVAVPLLNGDVPEAWDGIATITVDHSAGPNLEQLIATDADVIITSSVYAQFMPSVERSTGAQIVTMDVDSVDDVSGYITRLGELTGHESDAATLVSQISEHMSSTETGAEPVRVLAVFGTPHAFYAFLPSSYLGDLVAHAGGELITEDMRSHSVFRGLAPLSMEAVIAREPEHLLVVFHGSEESARAMLERDALWGQLSAVRAGHVSFLKDDLYAMRPGSELPRAIDEIKAIVSEARSRAQ